MKIVFMGTPDFAVPTLKKLYESKHEVVGVFTQTDKPKGRGYKLAPPPVKVLALEHATPVYQPKSLKNEPQMWDELKKLEPDCIVVAAYGKILPREVLEIPKYHCVNVHGSLLPKYRGAAPIQWSVLNGDAETGITTMLMGEGLDTGDILLQRSTPIGENETAAQLFDRLSEIGADLLIETLDKLEKGQITPVKQDDSKATYARMLSKDMCVLDFEKPVFEVHKKICGLSDWPCAVTFLKGKRLKVYGSEIVSRGPAKTPAGTVVNEKDLSVQCADGVLRFTVVQAEGSKRMSTQDYIRGNPVDKGIKLDME